MNNSNQAVSTFGARQIIRMFYTQWVPNFQTFISLFGYSTNIPIRLFKFFIHDNPGMDHRKWRFYRTINGYLDWTDKHRHTPELWQHIVVAHLLTTQGI